MLSTAIQKAKGDEEKKIGVSLKMPESFKNKLQATADQNSVSLNALIIAMLETVYESKENGNYSYDRYKELIQEVQSYDELIEKDVPFDVLGYDPYNAKAIAQAEMKKIMFYLEEQKEL